MTIADPVSSPDPRARSASPPTERVVAILSLLAQPTTCTLSGSEIARRLGLQKSTCHGILTSLDRSGLLVRSSRDKTYSLGPALIGLGRAAESAFPVADQARSALEQLHAELGLGCALATPIGGELTVVDRVGGDDLFPTGLQAGDRFAWVAPYGAVLRAWSDRDAIRSWLEGAPELGPARARRLRSALGAIREQGYAAWGIGEMGLRLRELREALDAVRESPRGEGLRVTLSQTFSAIARNSDVISHSTRRYPLSIGIAAAPVFDATGRPTHEVELHVYRDGVGRNDFKHLMGRLVAAADAITKAVGRSGS